MKRTALCVAVVLATLISLLTSCRAGNVTTTSVQPASTSPGTLPSTTAVAATTGPEAPIYGGELSVHAASDISGFDPAINIQMDCRAEYMVTDELIGENWAKGPAGSGETEWTVGFVGRMDLETGSLAESWTLPDTQTIIFNLRHGVKWQNKPPINGRELTAEDVVWNINRNFTSPKAYLYGAFPPALRPTSWRAIDRYTVEVKVPKESQGLMLVMIGDFMWMVPPDTVNTYGDMTNWKNVAGTGPFVLTDYVPASSVTYSRNPTYWKMDPVHPDKQLPYVDKLKTLIISDTSTQQAALRTGKLDRLDALEHEDAMSMMNTAPDLKYKKYLPSMNPVLAGRTDKAELPFKDIRVRQALNMAINKQEIVKTYYSGDAELFAYPYQPTKAYAPFYTPLDQQPQEVQDLFKFDPEKAKRLLAEAGYPNGFKTQVDCQTGTAADYLSMIKSYFSAINVDMQINPLEAGVFLSLSRAKSQKEMIFKNQTTHAPFRIMAARLESIDDHAYFETPRSRDTYNYVNANLFDEEACAKVLKDYGVYELSQCWGVFLPCPYYYVMWWPWVKGYHGEVTLGWDNQGKYAHYVWVDMAQKRAMGH